VITRYIIIYRHRRLLNAHKEKKVFSKADLKRNELKNFLKEHYEEYKKQQLKGCFSSFLQLIGGIEELQKYFHTQKSCQDLMEYAGFSRVFAYLKAKEIYSSKKRGK